MKKWIAAVVEAVLTGGAKTATKYLSNKQVVTATHSRGRKGSPSQSVVVTLGKPNYAQREKIKKWKKIGAGVPAKIIVASLALCLLPAMVQAQIDQPWLAEQAKLSVFSTVANIVRGPHYGEWWTDAGVAYRAYSFGDPSTKGPYASILILTRVVQIGDPTNTNLVISAAWREPLWFSDRFSVIFEVGAGNKLAIDGGEHREWGRIVSMAINCQIAKYSTFFVGGKIFDATAGQLNSAALGFGASINAGELLGEMVPKKD